MLTTSQWRSRVLSSLVMTLAAAAFLGYGTEVYWPAWALLIGFLILGNGAIFTLVAALNWRDARRDGRTTNTTTTQPAPR